MQSWWQAWRGKIGLWFLLLSLGFNVLSYSLGKFLDLAKHPDSLFSVGSDEITRLADTYRHLRQTLPPQERVGFLFRGTFDSYKHFLMIQYLLAPLLLDFSPHPRLVIGYFPDSPVDPQILTANGLFLLKDAGRGVFLFTKAKP